MALKFQCNQDPRKMKSVKGGKFCDQCCMKVFDLRRKSLDKIHKLKEEKGECCVIIYDDQLLQFESKYRAAKNLKNKKSFPLAAGFAAATLLTSNMAAQSNVKPHLTITEIRNAEGKSQKTLPDEKPEIKTTKKIFIRGYVAKSYKTIGKIHNFTIGYYNDSSRFVVLKRFSSNALGKFRIQLTDAELQLLQNNEYRVICGTHPVTHNQFNFVDLNENLVLTVKRRIQWVGKF